MRLAELFAGARGRALYAAASLGVLFSQDGALFLAARAAGLHLALPWWFWVNPFGAALMGAVLGPVDWPQWFGLSAMVATVAGMAIQVWLAFLRGARSRGGPWVAGMAMVPALQIGVIAWLTISPDRPVQSPERAELRLRVRTAVVGVVVGLGLILGAVTLSTLVFGVYGYALFMFSPFLIATVVAYLGNRAGRLARGQTTSLVLAAFGLGGAALLGLAIEGVLCILLASPLIAPMGWAGAELGKALAGTRRRGGGAVLSSVAVLPLLIAGEAVLPPHAAFESVEFTDVAAPPAAVWDSVVHMGPIPDAPAAPFRWGLAYPVSGEIRGAGVGAVRRGVFSTGVAYERVTEWTPEKKLSFMVLSDPPTMAELSPRANVRAPHLNGYFRTLDARFTLTPLANGKTRLSLATRHELDLAPALYWTAIARWAVHANKVRVLAHFRQQAESHRALGSHIGRRQTRARTEPRVSVG